MSKFYLSLFLTLMLVSGCKNNVQNNKKSTQIINNFDMNIFSDNGIKIFSIKSPYSSYQNNKNIFNLDKTTIHLFKDNDINYIINSDNSKLINNKLLELSGNVKVINNFQKSDKLYANSFIWDINLSQYLLIGNVMFENQTISLISNKATLNNTNNVIEFYNPVKYIIKGSNKDSGYEINSENAFYNIKTKSVSFKSKKDKVRSKIYF